MAPRAWIVTASLALLAGCEGSTSSDDEAEGLAEDANESQGTDDTSESPPESLAHDIDIALVEVNQGVATPIAVEGEWVVPEQRNAAISMGRDTLLRVHWALTPEFEPREIEARLTLEAPDTEPVIRTQTLMIEGPPNPGSLTGTFAFELLAEDMVPGLRFSVSLWEVDPEYAALPAPSVEPISPRTGELELVGVVPDPLEIKVVIVPMQLTWQGCATIADPVPVAQHFEDMLFMKNPTQSVTLELRDTPIVVTTEPEYIADLLEPVQQLRETEAADPNTYYYGLFRPCGVLSSGPTGIAVAVAEDDPGSAWQRAAVGMQIADLQWSADTFVHEVGHMQGLKHVYCPGQAAGNPDPTYPYDDGQIGVWGFGVRNFSLYWPTTAHDFMTYCFDGNWASDWTWRKTFQRIRTLTSWNQQDTASQADRTLLLGFIGDDGYERWWTTKGRISARTLERQRILPIAREGDREVALVGARTRVPDANGDLISIELPDVVPEQIELGLVDPSGSRGPIVVPSEVLERARGE